jgi:hypothetical protein
MHTQVSEALCDTRGMHSLQFGKEEPKYNSGKPGPTLPIRCFGLLNCYLQPTNLAGYL